MEFVMITSGGRLARSKCFMPVWDDSPFTASMG
jgi:hypothetical protein